MVILMKMLHSALKKKIVYTSSTMFLHSKFRVSNNISTFIVEQLI